MFDFSKEYMNDFSFWYPKVKDCGIPQPSTVFVRLPDYNSSEEAKRLYKAFYLENYAEDIAVIRKFIDEQVVPKLSESDIRGHLFLKNGRFSNKFDAAKSCDVFGYHELADHLARINYEDICADIGGEREIVVRKFIPYDRCNTPCIYHGLPLRPEARVFYDFDRKRTIFSTNYWDFDYVYPHLYDATDKIVFKSERALLKEKTETLLRLGERMVESAMKGVVGLDGQWSIDLLRDENDTIWLIDMAIAQRSAYWELRPDKVLYPD